jgi:hypothetical protein
MPHPANTDSSAPAKPENAPDPVRASEAERRPPRKRYFTDGTHLFEVLGTVLAYRLGRGTSRYIILRDCVSEATSKVDELQLAGLSLVR